MKYLGESIARAVPSAGLKGMAVKIAKQEGMAIVGQLLYVKGDLVNHNPFIVLPPFLVVVSITDSVPCLRCPALQ